MEDIFIGYRDVIGILDIQGIEDYLKQGGAPEIYLLTRNPLSERVQSYLKEHLKEPQVTVIVTNSFRKTAAEIKQKNKGKGVRIEDLDEFGRRRFTYDVC